jgi:hypothetical protein
MPKILTCFGPRIFPAIAFLHAGLVVELEACHSHFVDTLTDSIDQSVVIGDQSGNRGHTGEPQCDIVGGGDRRRARAAALRSITVSSKVPRGSKYFDQGGHAVRRAR